MNKMVTGAYQLALGKGDLLSHRLRRCALSVYLTESKAHETVVV